MLLDLYNINEASEAQQYRWKKREEKDAAHLKYIQTRNPEDKERFKKFADFSLFREKRINSINIYDI